MTLDEYVAWQKKLNPDFNEKRLKEVRRRRTLDWLNDMGTNIAPD